MIPIRDSSFTRRRSVIVPTLLILNVVIYLWDRNGAIFGPSLILGDLAMKPRDIMGVLSGQIDPTASVTLFTMMFLHVNLAHLIGNLIFLSVFGDNIEAVLGPIRFTLYYFLWGIAAAATHIFMMPNSAVPVMGASGAIGGVLGAYFLLFPGNRIRFVIFPFLFYPLTVIAWMMLGLWFVFQIVLPQQGVANWAHVGGFLAGMLTVMAMGGREKALAGIHFESDPDDED